MDRAERLIRAANPAGQRLSKGAEESLARILAISPAPTNPVVRPRSYRFRWTLSIAATVVLAVAISVAGILRPQPSFAATPPMLVITPTDDDARTALHNLASLASAQPGGAAVSRFTTQWWAVASEVDEHGTITASHVQPVRRVTTLSPNGGAHQADYAGEPYDARGRPVVDPNLPKPGAELGTVDIARDEMFFPLEPPSDPARFGAYLASAYESNATEPATDAMERIRVLLGERILTPTQNAALATYLSTLPDLEILGGTVDRLGRPAAVFAAPLNQETSTQMVLMFAADSGRVVATETIYRGASRTDIPSPAVLEYTAWEHP